MIDINDISVQEMKKPNGKVLLRAGVRIEIRQEISELSDINVDVIKKDLQEQVYNEIYGKVLN